jgi:hypothetical protein
MLRLGISIISLLILLAFTVLMPPTAFFDPHVTPDEVQLPDERPCENTQCADSLVWIDDQGQLRKEPLPLSRPISWPSHQHLEPQFAPEAEHQPPNRV